jgi:hypothetical protein
VRAAVVPRAAAAVVDLGPDSDQRRRPLSRGGRDDRGQRWLTAADGGPLSNVPLDTAVSGVQNLEAAVEVDFSRQQPKGALHCAATLVATDGSGRAGQTPMPSAEVAR